ncbi:aromatic ring-hydroxylating oxygenase subunit alpha [Aureispira anguillae]|uniref:Aromatic ring-hydroxylating dioxygenase subunit alpha n=1 Tax=Aureispira anguillae TaxID=2864201 RepID=A0A915YLV7_9BACT|nr:aromatic ring-hydroxylating dioxygenase subunit alpha [Aureispira anguillae]BDS15307.1 aromatic ring-hydroxylating dioxygenase subunit alpha [Aureispira anguillae]
MDGKKGMPILPVEAYTSQEWFEQEQELIFGNTWQFAGLIEDIQDPGDYITVQCGRQNILVVKGRDQRLRAFHNLCRHRGTQLLRAVGKKQKALTCPYHDWSYDLSGQLINVPEKEKEFPDLELDKICLHKAAVDIWRGMLWVHPDPKAMPITEWFKGCKEHLGPHQPQRLIEYPDTRYEKEIKANWKIVVENYIDVYHLAHLHSHTLNMYDHSKAKFGFVGDHYMFWEPLAKAYFDHLDELIPFKRIQEMTDEYIGAYVPWLFPSVGLAEGESSWSIFQVIPLAADRTKVIVRSKMEEMSDWEYYKQGEKSKKNWKRILGLSTKYESTDPNDPMASGDFMEEDIYVCEQQQKSLKNPLLSVMHTAQNGESTIRDFQKIVQKWMQPNRKK